jgi:hypothetical protein
MLLSLWAFCGSASAQLIFIPSNDAINSAIRELQGRGYLKGLSASERPWLISDVVQGILDEEPSLDSNSRRIAEEILAYFRTSKVVDSGLVDVAANASLGLRAMTRRSRDGYFYLDNILVGRGFRSELGSNYGLGFLMSRESRWGIYSKLIFDSDGTGYPWYYGTAHNARIVGQFDNAYLTFSIDRFSILLGRQRLIWGPSSRGSLLLNDTSPPLDMIWYQFSMKPVTVSGFGTRLDDYLDTLGISNRRYLSGHRLRLNPGKGWEFALSEIFLYGGPNRLPEFYYNIPVVLYYWEAQNRKQDDNALWGIDISWVGNGLGQCYAQFVFDDIQRQHRGPQKFAAQFGALLHPARFDGWSGLFELNLVDTYVYGQRKRINAYLNWGWPIGRLDSDQRECFWGVYKRLIPGTKLGFEFESRDKGQYYAANFQPGMAPFNVPFPSGVVEHIRNFALASVWEGSDYRHSRVAGRLAIGYQSIDNWQHYDGHSLEQLFAVFEASLGVNIGMPFWRKFH